MATKKPKPKPHLESEYCKGCGRCIEACRFNCIEMGTEIHPETGLVPVLFTLDDCTACGLCAESCQMDAIEIEDTAVVDPERCMGCGLCVAACEYNAIKLIEKGADEKWVPPRNIVETYVTIARERGKL